MKLTLLPKAWVVCQIEDVSEIDFRQPHVFLARTEEELSLVCEADHAPKNILKREDGWRCLKIAGPMDFSLVGILARIAACLAEKGIAVFAVSTYNTDYVLFKQEQASAAICALRADGHQVENAEEN